ncbi:MAG: hypothetical protein ACKO0Z_27105 [Betaproteobacteria bacterium]
MSEEQPNYSNARIAKCVNHDADVTVQYLHGDGFWVVTQGLQVCLSIFPQANELFDAVDDELLPDDLKLLWKEHRKLYDSKRETLMMEKSLMKVKDLIELLQDEYPEVVAVLQCDVDSNA